MNLSEAFKALREGNEEVPVPGRLPTSAEVGAVEKGMEVRFHFDFRRYLLEASDIVFSTLEPVQIVEPEGHTYLPKVAKGAWESMDVPRELIPLCEDNGDYYCMTKEGEVVFWSHNDAKVTEKWKNLATWIEEVWIGESEEG